MQPATNKALFITVEGGEGVGKTTNMAYIRDFMRRHNIQHTHTREPGGTPLAEQLRELLLAKRDEPVDEVAELLMVFAARAQHLKGKILPSLAAGRTVLCDRFTDATYAYQGYGRGLSLALIEQLEQTVQRGVHPDLTILLDLPVDVGLQRASDRGALDRFECEKIEFFNRVREGYLARAKLNSERFAVIDASRDLASVQADIEQVLMRFYQLEAL